MAAFAPDVGIGAGTQALGHIRPELQQGLRLVALERLCIGVGTDEVDAFHASLIM